MNTQTTLSIPESKKWILECTLCQHPARGCTPESAMLYVADDITHTPTHAQTHLLVHVARELHVAKPVLPLRAAAVGDVAYDAGGFHPREWKLPRVVIVPSLPVGVARQRPPLCVPAEREAFHGELARERGWASRGGEPNDTVLAQSLLLPNGVLTNRGRSVRCRRRLFRPQERLKTHDQESGGNLPEGD